MIYLKLNSLKSPTVTPESLTPYATKSMLKGYVVPAELSGYAKTSALSNSVVPAELTSYAKVSSLSNYVVPAELNAYAKTSDLSNYVVPSEQATYAKKCDIMDELNNYAPKQSIKGPTKLGYYGKPNVCLAQDPAKGLVVTPCNSTDVTMWTIDRTGRRISFNGQCLTTNSMRTAISSSDCDPTNANQQVDYIQEIVFTGPSSSTTNDNGNANMKYLIPNNGDYNMMGNQMIR
ncbi:hypothetical protein BDK51DRAFT_47505 [Blyttiomyces helicus]|uniref:Uncharacterized protein n=1 Tax=Blyttiomyces helicus TaxID=388810 RepID=A0A4P9WQW7_9FUNG|nr:hypothetical protein BDK51DRAFT_47505 [Blyttiomyces helicus]|eukprot:RKO94593.1 hypothetical protein BDK51DRAFT_47505 [Blyttiomyces helicus]